MAAGVFRARVRIWSPDVGGRELTADQLESAEDNRTKHNECQ